MFFCASFKIVSTGCYCTSKYRIIRHTIRRSLTSINALLQSCAYATAQICQEPNSTQRLQLSWLWLEAFPLFLQENGAEKATARKASKKAKRRKPNHCPHIAMKQTSEKVHSHACVIVCLGHCGTTCFQGISHCIMSMPKDISKMDNADAWRRSWVDMTEKAQRSMVHIQTLSFFTCHASAVSKRPWSTYLSVLSQLFHGRYALLYFFTSWSELPCMNAFTQLLTFPYLYRTDLL